MLYIGCLREDSLEISSSRVFFLKTQNCINFITCKFLLPSESLFLFQLLQTHTLCVRIQIHFIFLVFFLKLKLFVGLNSNKRECITDQHRFYSFIEG